MRGGKELDLYYMWAKVLSEVQRFTETPESEVWMTRATHVVCPQADVPQLRRFPIWTYVHACPVCMNLLREDGSRSSRWKGEADLNTRGANKPGADRDGAP